MNGSKILFAYGQRLINGPLENSRPYPTRMGAFYKAVIGHGSSKQIFQIHVRGRKIVFTDIDRLQKLMLDEIDNDKKISQ